MFRTSRRDYDEEPLRSLVAALMRIMQRGFMRRRLNSPAGPLSIISHLLSSNVLTPFDSARPNLEHRVHPLAYAHADLARTFE